MHLGIPFQGQCIAKSIIHYCLNDIYCVQTAILSMPPPPTCNTPFWNITLPILNRDVFGNKDESSFNSMRLQLLQLNGRF